MCYTCFGILFLHHFLHWAKHEKETGRWTRITLTTFCENNKCGGRVFFRWRKEVQETSNSNKSLELWVCKESQNIPRTWIQVHTCQEKMNITSGCLQPLHIQKELGWRSAECCVETSAGSWVKLPALSKRIEMSPRESPARCWKIWGGRVCSISSPNFLTHFTLLFLTEWFFNSVAESCTSRGTGTWGRHQLWAREANVLSEHRVKRKTMFWDSPHVLWRTFYKNP